MITIKLYALIYAIACTLMLGRSPIKPDAVELWNGTASVIVARIDGVEERSIGAHKLKLEPLYTVCGHFNPAENAILEAAVYSQGESVSLLKKDELILAVIFDQSKSTEPHPGLFLVEGEFMPDARAYVRLKGLDDPVIAQTRELVRAAKPQ